MKDKMFCGRKGARLCLPMCEHGERWCPRCQAYDLLPKSRLLQSLITSVMGTPHEGQRPILKQSKTTRLLIVFGGFFGSVAASSFTATILLTGSSSARFMLLPLLVSTISMTSGITRSMSMYVLHYASHGAFGGHSRLIGHTASTLVFVLSLDEYTLKHIRQHHPFLVGEKDPDQQEIVALGFIPGMTFNYYRMQLLKTLLSPRLFTLHLRGRLRSQFARTQPIRVKVITAIVHTLPPAFFAYEVYTSGRWIYTLVWAVAWLLPLTYGSYVSMVLFSLALHKWFLRREPGMTERDFYYAKTCARFFGDPAPSPDLSLLKWCRAWLLWWSRFFILHLLVGKFFVMGLSDSQHHDAHHTDPQGKEFQWWDNIQSRHYLATVGRDAAKMSHTWGSPFEDIRHNFMRMAQTPNLDLGEFMQEADHDSEFLNRM